MHWVVLSYVATFVAAILVYELIRSWIKRRLRRRFERNLQTFLNNPDLYHQSFKFTNKLVIKNQLLADPEIHETMLRFAQREGVSLEDARRRVESYVEEMVPNFNMLSYYKLGYTVARGFIHSLYDPVVDQERARVLDELPKSATPVYVINHRSNVDFVLLAYLLAGRASVSYAVGEWARVWPLEHLFKSFGSYMVRRGYKEDLYHKVLERYVQLQAKHGVVQAMFPEGRITRDGQLLPPKFGLFQFLSGVAADPDYKGDLVFVPVGINYDWVIEDYNLVAESEGRPEKRGFWKKIQVMVSGPFVFFGLLIVNGTRYVLGRLKLHGYASVSFGEPLSLKQWMQEQDVDFSQLSYEERKPHVGALGTHVLGRIGKAIPATPVTVLSIALLDHPRDVYEYADLIRYVSEARDHLESHGVRVVVGKEFHRFRRALSELDLARGRERPKELGDVERAFVRQEENEELVRFATDVMRRNKILKRKGSTWTIRAERANYVRYYANSIAHRIGRNFPIASEARDDSAAADVVQGARP